MGQQWVKWCEDHIYSLKEVGGLFDFKGYTVWQAGEIATAWVLHDIPWITDYKAGQVRPRTISSLINHNDFIWGTNCTLLDKQINCVVQ